MRHQRTTSDCLRNAVAAGSSPRRAGRNVDTATHWPFTEMVVNSLTCFASPDPSPIETRITMYHRAAATRQRSNASRWSASPRSRAYKDVEAALVLCRKGKHTDAYCSVNVQLQELASMKALLIIVVAALAAPTILVKEPSSVSSRSNQASNAIQLLKGPRQWLQRRSSKLSALNRRWRNYYFNRTGSVHSLCRTGLSWRP